MSEKIIITDDKGVEREFTNFTDLVEFIDSFLMSFLPDNFSYRIERSKKWQMNTD